MLYQILRPIANISFRSLLSKINVIDADKFPKDGPVVLACNHPTAFLEPCLIACFVDRPLYFIVRGDFFKNPIFRKFMFAAHLIPIHRSEGGIANIKKNYKIFNYCYDSLENNETILIMAEGKTTQHKRLGPLKKGTGRIALGFMDARGREDALVVPVGVNFTRADFWRTDVTIVVGDPIAVSDFKEEMAEHPNVGFEALNEVVGTKLRDNMIYVENEEDDEAVEFMLHFERINFINTLFPHASTNRSIFKGQQEIAESFNLIKDRSGLRERILALKSSLLEKKINTEHLNLLKAIKKNSIIALFLLFPFFVIGVFTNIGSFLVANAFVNTKVKQLEFVGPIRIAIILGSNLFLWPLLVMLSIYSGSILLTIIYLFKPFFGFIALKYWDRYHEYINTRAYQMQSKDWRQNFESKLSAVRSELIN